MSLLLILFVLIENIHFLSLPYFIYSGMSGFYFKYTDNACQACRCFSGIGFLFP